MKKLIIVLSLLLTILFTGCLEGEVGESCRRQNLVGYWESDVVNGYYIHEKILAVDGTYQGTWYYATNHGIYSQVTGTWTLDGGNLRIVTNHIDSYPITCIDSNTFQLQIDDELRIYHRS